MLLPSIASGIAAETRMLLLEINELPLIVPILLILFMEKKWDMGTSLGKRKYTWLNYLFFNFLPLKTCSSLSQLREDILLFNRKSVNKAA